MERGCRWNHRALWGSSVISVWVGHQTTEFSGSSPLLFLLKHSMKYFHSSWLGRLTPPLPRNSLQRPTRKMQSTNTLRSITTSTFTQPSWEMNIGKPSVYIRWNPIQRITYYTGGFAFGFLAIKCHKYQTHRVVFSFRLLFCLGGGAAELTF